MNLRSPTALAVVGIVATLVLALMVVITLLQTGDGTSVSDNAALIGALVALGGIFTTQIVTTALEDRRAEGARELEAQRTHEAALQNYLKEVGKLLIEQPLRRATPGDYLSTVVRAQTLTALEGLDPNRKRILVQFLYEAGLIHAGKPVVSLRLANLMGVNLSNDYSSKRDYGLLDLSSVDLSGANLEGADLRNAALFGGGNLRRCNLRGANLFHANLWIANLGESNLSGANLSNTLLSGATLSESDLSEANLSESNLSGANLSKANLSSADFSNANLKYANLEGATGITIQELEQQAASLENAKMPDGSRRVNEKVKRRFERRYGPGSFPDF